MIDHRIILNILYHTSYETSVSTYEDRMNFSKTASFIFFQFGKKGYYKKLTALSSQQYLQRLNVLCPVLGRIN